jgi:hypothetical protein
MTSLPWDSVIISKQGYILVPSEMKEREYSHRELLHNIIKGNSGFAEKAFSRRVQEPWKTEMVEG